ncbi:MAG: M3 family oligoendopeptidase [Planctomycetales bacterium]|nr:M3 family oligoendopeptidase [Planctomycetales bacterium]
MTEVNFESYAPPAPLRDDVAAEYQKVWDALDASADEESAAAGVECWDALRRQLGTWMSLAQIRFHQDTQNDVYRKNRDYADQLQPYLTDLDVQTKRRLLDSPFREGLERRFGHQAFALWRCDVASFEPVLADDLVRQAGLVAEYTELIAGARFEFRGRTQTLSDMAKYAEYPGRAVRHEAATLRWNWFNEHVDEIDQLFDSLVGLRQSMAEKMGHKTFTSLGYEWMHRLDYGAEDVDSFRAQVREHVVPLAMEIRRRQGERLGIEPLMQWDEAIQDLSGNPRPQGDHDWMLERAAEMFADVGQGMDDFFQLMRRQRLLDLKSRPNKASGGFCDMLPSLGMPFIFANFNGAKHDVEVFTHEIGHAFQAYSSRDLALIDYHFPTYEACEIHSMGLEFLTWPSMERFFGDDADRFRRLHLTDSLLFIPYGTAVDHFQHLVYANPTASPAERAEMWQEMERLYLPTLKWGDLAFPASGRRWQAQPHIFGSPFYYIDYVLALTCALQLWDSAQTNRAETLKRYVALCQLGGSQSFKQLVDAAGLANPFEAGCLPRVVSRAEQSL